MMRGSPRCVWHTAGEAMEANHESDLTVLHLFGSCVVHYDFIVRLRQYS